MTEILTSSEDETSAAGARLGESLQAGAVLLLYGNLGAGKTAFVRGLARGLGAQDDEVTSPTFTIVHEYQAARSKVYHLDLYRLRDARELESIGWDDILQETALVIVEWPGRAASLMPHGHVPISLSHVEDSPDHRILYAGGHT